jgi:hypothetical protein
LISKNIKIKIYRTIILPVVLHGCETLSLTLMEERRLRVFENMVMRRMLGPKRNDATGEWRRQHNEKLNDLYFSPYTVRVIKKKEMGGTRSTYGERRGSYRVLVGRPEVKRPIGRPRRIIVKWVFKKWDGETWTGLIWLRLGTGDGAC